MRDSLRLKRLLLEAGVGLLGAELNPLVAELSEPNRSPNRSVPDVCRDELTLEPTPEPVPIPNGSKRSPTAAVKKIKYNNKRKRLLRYHDEKKFVNIYVLSLEWLHSSGR